MNQSYKLVWNALQQVWVVASELAKGHKKAWSQQLIVSVCAALACSSTLAAPAAQALPQLANISSGTATVSNPVQGQLLVNQTTDKLIANWSSFNVGAQARVDFIQPDSSSIALNRIASTAPSEIFGQVNANGQLILVNPAGLVFGAQSQVNAASIIATTHNINDIRFNNNNLQFDSNGSQASVENQGQLTATHGNIVLLANTIKNSGMIQSQRGNISLVNASRAVVNSNDVTISLPSRVAGLIQNSGTLTATRIASNKGQIFLLGERYQATSNIEVAGMLDAKSTVVYGRNIQVQNALTLKGNTVFKASRNIIVNAPVHAISNNRLLSLAYGARATDGVSFGSAGKINLSGMNMQYRENGQYYQIINTLDELQAIDSGDIGNTDFSALAGKYVLGADIDATTTIGWNYGAGFSPLGGNGVAFTGKFNGLGHQISNLHIYRPDFDENSSQGGAVFPDPYGFSGYNIGLFGVAQNATLKNIRLSNVNIVGYENVGGLVGQNSSTANGQSVLENNQVSGSIRGAYTAEEVCVSYECESEGAPFDGYAFTGGSSVGGLVGLNQVSGHSLVQGNSTSVNVKGNFNIGGLAGNQVINSLASATLQKNSSQGNISGNAAAAGLIGRDSNRLGGTSLIQKNHADTAITGSIYQLTNYAGGLIGYVDTVSNGSTLIRHNSATGTISGDSYLGGLVGMASSNSAQIAIFHNYATGSVTGKAVLGGLVGYNATRNGAINIRDTYASGLVRMTTTGGLAAGLVGANSIFRDAGRTANISISNSYWDVDSTGQTQAVANTGGTRSNLNPVSSTGSTYPSAFSKASYANFDFERVWSIEDGVSRPTLRAFDK